MNTQLLIEIAELAMQLAENATDGKQTAETATAALLAILQKTDQLYQQQTGKPLDLSLIREERCI